MRIATALVVILTCTGTQEAPMWSAPQPLQDRDGVLDISTQILTVQLRKLVAIDRCVITTSNMMLNLLLYNHLIEMCPILKMLTATLATDIFN